MIDRKAVAREYRRLADKAKEKGKSRHGLVTTVARKFQCSRAYVYFCINNHNDGSLQRDGNHGA